MNGGDMKSSNALRLAVFWLILVFSTVSSATNYQDLWWNPAESGWGVSVTHQGNTLFAAWYLYDASQRGTWFVMSNGEKTGDGIYTGILYQSSGPSYSTVIYDPAKFSLKEIGNATFSFSDAHHGTLKFTANGWSIAKKIERLTYANLPLAGTYWSSVAGAYTCDTASAIGTPYRVDNSDYVIEVSGNQLSLAFKIYGSNSSTIIYSCTAIGPFSQSGSLISLTAPFSCSDNSGGTLEVSNMSVDESGFLADAVWTYDDQCIERENVAGVRHAASAPTSAGSLQFSAANYSVAENGHAAMIAVTRNGGSKGRVTVNYASSNGTATAGLDYSTTLGTLSFEDGDTAAKIFTVPIVDDSLAEGDETAVLKLSSPTGGATLGSPAQATLTITDDDSGSGGTEVIDTGGGSVTYGGLTINIPQNGFTTPTRVSVTSGTPSSDFADATVLSGVYTVEIEGDLKQPIQVQMPSSGTVNGKVFAVFASDFYTSMSDTPTFSGRLIKAEIIGNMLSTTISENPMKIADEVVLLTQTNTKAGVVAKRRFSIWFVAGYDALASTHFEIVYPVKTCSSTIIREYVNYAEEAYQKLIDNLHFDPSGRLTIPMRINVHELNSTMYGRGGYGMTVFENGTRSIDLDLNSLYCNNSSPDIMQEMKATVGHEFFHAIQFIYDPHWALRELLFGTAFDWLYEASSVWFEAEMLGNPSYVSKVLNYDYYRTGLEHGAIDGGITAQDHGYGASTFLRYLTDKFGNDLMLTMWTRIKQGVVDNASDAINRTIYIGPEWQTFAEQFLTGTTKFTGWATPSSNTNLVFANTTPAKEFREELYPLSALKVNLQTRMSATTSKFTIEIVEGKSNFIKAFLYQGTKKLAEFTEKYEFDATPTSNFSLFIIDNNDVSPYLTSTFVKAKIATGPSITSLSPATGAVGTTVTITGTGFGNTQGTLTFNATAANVSSWTDTKIVCTVPPGATTGNVVVTANGLKSDPIPFTVPLSPEVWWCKSFSFPGAWTQTTDEKCNGDNKPLAGTTTINSDGTLLSSSGKGGSWSASSGLDSSDKTRKWYVSVSYNSNGSSFDGTVQANCSILGHSYSSTDFDLGCTTWTRK